MKQKFLTRFVITFFTGLLCVACSLGLAACTQSSSSESSSNSATNTNATTSIAPAQDTNTVVVSMPTTSEPARGFDPLYSWGSGEHVHEPLIQSTLIKTDENLNFENDLATAYTCSEDGMEWTFTIRSDVKFSDGVALTAHDVAFTLNGIRNNEASETDLSFIKEVVADNETTVRVLMNKPYNALLYTLAVIGIVPEHAYSETYGEAPIGSGRYMLEEWVRGEKATFVANPNYYGSTPGIQKLIVLFMEEDASLAAAQAGEVDVAYTSAVLANAQVQGASLLSCETVDSRGISLPCVDAGGTKQDGSQTYECGNNVTSDVAIRQALNYGIDRLALINNVLDGHAQPSYSVCDSLPWGNANLACEYDAEKAREILEAAGWSKASDGIYEKSVNAEGAEGVEGTEGGQETIRAEFNLYYSSNDSARQALATEVANQAKNLGIEIHLIGASWDEIYAHEFSDAVLWGWGSNSTTELYQLNYSSGWGNYSSYESAEVDAAFDAALATSNIEDSYALWQQGQETLGAADNATWLWLVNVDHLYFKRDGLNVADQKPHPHGHGWSLVNNVDEWDWSE